MKNFVRLLVVLLVGMCSLSYSQGYDLRFVVTQNDGVTFRATVQIQRTGSAFNLGTSNFIFIYNNSAMTYSSFNPISFSGAPYLTMTAVPNGSSVSLNIVLIPPTVGTTVPASWLDVASIIFNISNSSASSNLTWDDDGTTAFTDGGVQVSQGTFTPLDSTLPVQLAAFKAQSTATGVLLEWRTESEINNLGFNLYRSQSSNAEFAKVNPNLIAGAGNSTQALDYRYTDDRVQKTGTYYYRLESVDVNGKRESYPAVQVEVAKIVVPDQYYANQNYPNPFNPSTSIKYGLPEASHVRIEIFNLRGEQVVVLQDGEQAAGTFELTWDGRNANGQVVPTGVYLYRINAGSFTDSKKMIFAK